MTNLVRGLDEQGFKGLFQGVGDKWKTLEQGASTLVVAAFDPGLHGRYTSPRIGGSRADVRTGETGVYVEDCQMRKPARWASDASKAERLWALSEELIAKGAKKTGRL